MKKLPLVFAAAAILAALPASAAEEKAAEREFGNASVINISANTSLDLTFGSRKAPDPGGKTSVTNFGLGIGADYFVVDNVSVGVLFNFKHESEKEDGASDASTRTTFGIGPRVGYNVWITPGQLSLWPQVAFLYQSVSTAKGSNDGPSASLGTLDVFVPLLIHPVSHFHFAIGPYFSTDLMSKAKVPPLTDSVDGEKATLFGLRGEIAGWL